MVSLMILYHFGLILFCAWFIFVKISSHSSSFFDSGSRICSRYMMFHFFRFSLFCLYWSPIMSSIVTEPPSVLSCISGLLVLIFMLCLFISVIASLMYWLNLLLLFS